MNVLVPTLRSDLLGGAETVVRDLVVGLRRRGHSAVVFSEGFSKSAAPPMEAESIVVVRDLDTLPFRPDVIHGHFSLETMMALTALPGVPAVYHCHGAGHLGAPPSHPRIYRYVAITPSLAQRLMVESNIEESAMVVGLNGIDLSRFTTVRTPPKRLRRALLFNNYHRPESRTLLEVRTAAEAAGMQLDCIGQRLGRSVDHPEEVLPAYDLVFASGRSAIEALACGCAVVVIGLTSCGELVGAENFERLRRANFSAAVNSAPPSADRIQAEIGRYSPDECAAVTHRIRREADQELVISQMETIYAQAIAQHLATPQDRRAEHHAVARYLRKIAPIIKLIDEAQTVHGLVAHTAAAASRAAAGMSTL